MDFRQRIRVVISSLVKNLRARGTLSSHDEEILRSIISKPAVFDAGQNIVWQGSRNHHLTLLLEGFAARYKISQHGKRQITALYVAGDFVDLSELLITSVDEGVVAISPCRAGFATHSDLYKILSTHSQMTRLFWLLTAVEGAVHRERMAAMCRSTKSSIAHLLCELSVRLSVAGKASQHRFFLPLTQIDLADALGISVVHLNRILRLMREDRVVSWVQRSIVISNWDLLRTIAEFNSDYLQFSGTVMPPHLAQ